MTKKPRYPKGQVWPAEMRADMAAAYVDEPSVDAFLRKVGIVYPQPVRFEGSAQKWSKATLDRAISNRHRLNEDEDISELI